MAGVRWIGGLRVRQGLLKGGATLLERPLGVVGVVQRQQVEGNEARRRLLRQQPDPAGGRVDALLQHLELQPVADHNDDLAVDHAPLGQIGFDRLHDLGK